MISFFKNKTVKNASWIIAERVIQMIINFLVGIWTARYLGPSDYGLINYAGAYTSFFMSFCTLGINSVIVKEFVEHPHCEGEIIGTTLGLRAISSFLSAFTIILIASIVDHNEPTTIYVVALCSIGLIFNIFNTFTYWFQSRLQSKVTSIATLIAYIITAAYKTYLLITGKSVILFALSTSIDYICVGIGLVFAYYKFNGSKLTFSFSYGKVLLKKSYHFILPSLMVAIYGQTDKLMLKKMIGEAEIGFYATAASLCSVWCFVLTAIIDSMYPTIMKLNNENQQEFNRYNRILYAIVFYISVFVSFGFTFFADLIVEMLYGEAYTGAIAPLKIITWYTAFSYLGIARNAWIVSKNKQKKLIYLYFFSAVANVVLNMLLIPYLGATGAAIASLLAQVFTTIVVPLFIKDYRENTILIINAILLRGLWK